MGGCDSYQVNMVVVSLNAMKTSVVKRTLHLLSNSAIRCGVVLTKTGHAGFQQNYPKRWSHDRWTLQMAINMATLLSAQSVVTLGGSECQNFGTASKLPFSERWDLQTVTK